jgi:hypothetical protein
VIAKALRKAKLFKVAILRMGDMAMTSIGLTSSRRTGVQTHITADMMMIAMGWLVLFLVIVGLTVSSDAFSDAIESVATLS